MEASCLTSSVPVVLQLQDLRFRIQAEEMELKITQNPYIIKLAFLNQRSAAFIDCCSRRIASIFTRV